MGVTVSQSKWKKNPIERNCTVNLTLAYFVGCRHVRHIQNWTLMTPIAELDTNDCHAVFVHLRHFVTFFQTACDTVSVRITLTFCC